MALQASPRAQTSIPPDAFAPEAPTSRHHYAPTSPIPPDTSRSPDSVPSSSRRPSRQRSGNGSSQPATPQQGSQRSPNPNVNSSGSTARPTTSQPSPRTPTAASASQSSRREQSEDLSQQSGSTIIPPPRTSSTQKISSSTYPAEQALPERSRHRGADSQGGRGASEGKAREQVENNASSSSSSRKRPVGFLPGDVKRAASTKESPRQQQEPMVGQAFSTDDAPRRPVTLRQDSEIINRVVIDDPQVDIVREMERQAEAVPATSSPATPITRVQTEESRETNNSQEPRSRQNFSTSAGKRKETKFGEYILGQTLGEGEFGKVKLGWKKDGSVEVAIKLIRRENLNTNPSRLPKIHREISILHELAHPNIVRLHEMVETERHIGIILEYASGGELFDYILKHRYLKDNAARRLFAQLVSGVGYLHKKGIVHRDLKLENLLLDRNRNIIITDFGFANTFDPRDELSEEIEFNLTNRDFVKRMDLERVVNGFRRGDLMQTSCGSPCYAAPELVVTDSLYTGRKVDVWSCGVILYAMLAGYLPFDDDPANPEGDNINLLYKYIVSTPLTFPEYVTPHSRDLLRRILVPDPRKRADLFEVARHSWLSEYAHVVVHVTSSTTTIGDITNTTITDGYAEPPLLARSASVREPSKAHISHSGTLTPVGGLIHQGKLDETDKGKGRADSKRRTVQVEYVAPQSQTARGELSPVPSQQTPERLAASGSQTAQRSPRSGGTPARKPVPQDAAVAADRSRPNTRQKQDSAGQGEMKPPSRPVREPPRAVSDSANAFGQVTTVPGASIARPNTGGSMSSGGGRLPSRGNSYGQPIAPTVATTNAQGRLAQPKSSNRSYNISAPIPHPEPYISEASTDRPVSQRIPTRYSQAVAGEVKGHKRANTFGNVFSRSGSLFGGRSQPQSPAEGTRPSEKKYPPTSMKNAIGTESPRLSSDSRRPSFGFSRKNSDLNRQERQERQEARQDKPRRFSLLPASFSFKGLTGGAKDQQYVDGQGYSPEPKLPSIPAAEYRGATSAGPTYDDGRDLQNRHVSAPLSARPPRSAPQPSQGGQSNNPRYPSAAGPTTATTSVPYTAANWQQQGQQQPMSTSYRYTEPAEATPSSSYQGSSQQQPVLKPRYPPGFNEYENNEQQPNLRPSTQQQQQNQGGNRPGGRVLQKPNRKFTDAYEQEQDPGHHAGTSGAAKRVMDFFRRRGKARSGE